MRRYVQWITAIEHSSSATSRGSEPCVDAIAAAFSERLKKVAGFQFVPDPLPMRNTKKNVIDYLFLASPKDVAQKIIADIFDKHR